MTETECLSRDKLRRYLLGELPESESVHVLSHLEDCSDCEATVSALDRESDTLVESLRKPVVQPDLASAYRLAAKRVASCPPDSSQVADESSPLRTLRDYELIGPLARGGMGMVYRARHVRLNRQVAVKVLPGRWLKDPTVVARFEREMQAVGSLRHPAIVQATDGGEADGVHFLVMELVDGLDGATLVQCCGPLPIADACEIVRQAAVGMAYVHANGIVHRDLKPSNLMITISGEVKILDLGLARVTGEQLTEDELTTVGQLMGTLEYMAPEQLENSHHVDERTDIFSLGATLYKLLTGKTPHSMQPREPLLSKLRRIASEPTTPIASCRSELPVPLCELVDRMLSQRTDDRPQSMQSIADALAEWTNHSDLVTRVKEATKIREQQPTGDHSSSPTPRNTLLALPKAAPVVVAPPRRNRWLAIVATGFFGIAMALSMVITLQLTSGQLVIETSSPDVKVQILKAGQPHRQLTLNQTANSLRLGAGEYDIEIISEADGLRIENGRFTLNRGETWLAKIVHEEGAPAAEVTRAEEPTYDGRTLDQWIALLLQDRSPKQFVDATRALEKLAIGPREDDAIMAVLTAMRFHSWDAKHIDEKGNSLSLSQSVVSFLKGRDPKVVTNALSRELDLRKEANIDLIVKVLIPSNQDLRPHFEERLQGQIIQLADDDSPGRRIDALNALYFVSGRDRVIERLTDALDDTDPRVQLFAAEKLIGIKANIDQVVSTLRTLLQVGELEHRANAAWFLGDLGAAAESALPELIEIVQQDDESDISQAAVYRNDRNGGVSKVSVKGAAIHAIAEIGNQSALPVLTELWIARETGNNSPTNQGRRPGSSLVSHLVNAEHVEQAIEQLTGMRPVWNDEAGKIVWTAEGMFFSQAFKLVFEGKFTPKDDFVGLATRLLPYTSEFERKQAIESIGVLQMPSARQLSLQLEMIDLLAKHDDAHAVMMAVFNRIDLLMGSFHTLEAPVPLNDVVAAYLHSAFQIWVTLEPSLKSESLVSPLSTIGRSSEAIQGMPDTLICEWLSSPEHLKSLYDRILKTNPPYWYLAIFGLSQLGLADDETFELLTSRFVRESLDRTLQERTDPKRLLLAFVYTLHWQPELTQRLIDLLEDPRMDVAYVRFLHEDRVEEKVSLRGAILANLQDVPADLRKAFVPMLRQLVESGTRTEANVAKSLLNIWEM